MKKAKKIHIIINPASGKDRPMLQVFNRVFTSQNIDWDVSVTKKRGDAGKFARKAARRGVDCVVVYGGDGTIMEAAGGLLKKNIPLLPLRGGTGNVIASELGIPLDLEKACRLVVKKYKIRTSDVGKLGRHYFLLRVSVGYEANMVKLTERQSKNKIGTLAYAVSAFKALVGTKTAQYTINIDGEKKETEGFTCIIANSGNLGVPGLTLAPNINISDGYFDVIVIRSPEMTDFFSLKRFVIDRRQSSRSFMHWKGKDIRVTSKPRQDIQCDGEIMDRKTVSVKMIPKSILLVCG